MVLYQQQQQLLQPLPVAQNGGVGRGVVPLPSSSMLIQHPSLQTPSYIQQGPYLSGGPQFFQSQQQQQQQQQASIVYHHYYHHLHHHHYLNSGNPMITGNNTSTSYVWGSNTGSGPISNYHLNNNHHYHNQNRGSVLHHQQQQPNIGNYRLSQNRLNTIDPIVMFQNSPQSIVCPIAALPPPSNRLAAPFINNEPQQYKSHLMTPSQQSGWILTSGSATPVSNQIAMPAPLPPPPPPPSSPSTPLLISTEQNLSSTASPSSSTSSASLYPDSSSASSSASTSPPTSDPDTTGSDNSNSSSSPELEDDKRETSNIESSTSTPSTVVKSTETVFPLSPIISDNSATPTAALPVNNETPVLKPVSAAATTTSGPVQLPLPQNTVPFPVQYTIPGYQISTAVPPTSLQFIQSPLSPPLPSQQPLPQIFQQFSTLPPAMSAPPPPPPPPPSASGIALRDYYAQFGVYYKLTPWNQSYGMERVWMSEFRRIFSNFYCELWSIQPVERKPGGIRLNMFVDSAKVRFCCEKCGHSWTSMKGRIVFWFGLLSPNFNIGLVAIKLFGQRCEACAVEMFQQPMWYPEEVTKVLMNLFNRVGQIYYGFEKTKFEKQRRIGKPRTPHNQYLCQACTEGICLSRRRQMSCEQEQVSGTTNPSTTEPEIKPEEELEDLETQKLQQVKSESEEQDSDDTEPEQQSTIRVRIEVKDQSKPEFQKVSKDLLVKNSFDVEDDEDSEDSGIVSLI